MIYLTGDTHGNFDRIRRFCELNNTTKDDVLIILGDAGINYYLNKRDYKLKQELQNLKKRFVPANNTIISKLIMNLSVEQAEGMKQPYTNTNVVNAESV